MTLIDSLLRGDLAAAFSWIIAVTLALTVHEYAHARLADLAGDPTPRSRGRVTLNPLAHYDPVGSTLILLFGFGWGKPVPVNPGLFRSPRRDNIRVSLGGIAANLITATVFGLVLRTGVVPEAYQQLFLLIVLLNLALACFNILPLPPLDGSHALPNLLPPAPARKVTAFYAKWGMIPLVVFIVSLNLVPLVGAILWIPISALTWLLTGSPGGF